MRKKVIAMVPIAGTNAACGAIAKCQDRTYSFSKSHLECFPGTCRGQLAITQNDGKSHLFHLIQLYGYIVQFD